MKQTGPLSGMEKLSGMKRRIASRLLSWYNKSRRDLPWRRTIDPYRIWVSEVMLQQTQVDTVIPYYHRFFERFPAVKELARAGLKEVLKSWEGMGYYQRARNLHRAAQMVERRWKGRIPSSPGDLESLPGIGRSTAGAIASIAFGKKAPILDGNVKRVLCRLFAVQENPKLPSVQKRLWLLSEGLLPGKDVGPFNQALMELGATVCLPKRPTCLLCPVMDFCESRRLSLQDRIPVRTSARPIPRQLVSVGIIMNGMRLLLGPRPEQGLLGGLWGFPEIETAKEETRADPKALYMALRKKTGLDLNLAASLEAVTHVYSHKRVTYLPYLFRCRGGRVRPLPPWRWIPMARLNGYPLSTATRRMLDQLQARLQIKETLPLAAESRPSYRP